MPSSSRPGIYEDGLLHHDDTCRHWLRFVRFLAMVLAWRYRDVRTFVRRAKDARQTATYRVRVAEWYEL
jgi:hypothetical protein